MSKEKIYLKTELKDGVYQLWLSNDDDKWVEGNITTEVDPGDKVKWRLATNSGISSIDNIVAKPGSINLFSSGPKKVSDSKWKGTISENAERGTSESYSISYTPTGASQQTDDPIINVRQE